MSRFSDPDRTAALRAAAQSGALAHFQAAAAGLSDDQIVHRCRHGAWTRRVRGVYIVAGSPDTPQQRAWVAWLAVAEAGGVLSHVTAAAIHGLVPFSPLPHVTVPATASARAKPARVHRGTVPMLDQVRRSGLRVTAVSRTLADLAGWLDRPGFEAVVDDALCRRFATPASTIAASDRAGKGRRGVQLLRAVLEVWSERIEPGSVAEMRLLRQLGVLGVDNLVSQHEVRDAAGDFVAKLDLADPSILRAFEYDGINPHNPRRWARDEPRYERLRALGWHVDVVTKLDLLPGESRLRDLAEEWLRSRAA